MSFTREEWEEKRLEIMGERQRQRFQVEPYAEVHAKLLTGDPKWDVFLQRLQKFKEIHESTATSASAKILGPSLDPDEMIVAKFEYHRATAIVAALNQVMRWPSEILKGERDDAEVA